MGLKNDKWIRKMALEHKMIEPFADRQVRDGVISYGVSSYGYDIRIAREFKVFTNLNTSIVDPKNFDPLAFVSVETDACIIPPNSFVLGKSVEYMRIPRGVLTICLGKSTYARCFSGNTKVALANGESATLKDMARRAEKGERFFGYGISPSLGIVITELTAPRKIAANEELVRVYLDNGQTIDATPDHKFLTRKGKYVQAKNLQPNDSLMPLYRYHSSIHAKAHNAVYYGEGFDREAHRSAGSVVGASRLLNVSAPTVDKLAKRIIPNLRKNGIINSTNHKVEKVVRLKDRHDVYCLTSVETGNFALEAGVFVKNCGLIVNVTPLEPSWNGYITLEISNTTPLPAKIYANEGIAQLLFFEADEECAVSYADKHGKYQDQQGIVLPKL